VSRAAFAAKGIAQYNTAKASNLTCPIQCLGRHHNMACTLTANGLGIPKEISAGMGAGKGAGLRRWACIQAIVGHTTAAQKGVIEEPEK
jgi:hypothetical protein